MLDWSAACAAGPGAAGGKGWNLGRLHRYGFPVPAGGVVSSAAYRSFMCRPDLAARVSALAGLSAAEAAGPAAADALEHLRRLILAAPLPADLAAALPTFLEETGLLHAPVAVRSSATAEDSAAASFAGIHHSFLNVSGLAAISEAIRGCYASLWTPQAVVYRRRLGLSDDAVAAAVVILAMVPARAAGVCFTCDPRTGRRDQFALSATHGLGDALVSGHVEPDEYLVCPTSYPPVILDQRIAHAKPALSDDQVLQLALLAGRVQDALGEMEQPQDIEWAHDGDQFWLVQARPVTNLPEPTFPAVAGQQVVWSNANLRDVIPGVLSPLGWSLLRTGMELLLTTPLKDGGWPYDGGVNWVRLFAGRAYFHLTAMHWAYYDALGMEPAEFNQVIGGHQPESVLPPPTRADRLSRSLRRLRTIGATFRMMRAAQSVFRTQWNWAEEAERLPFDQWNGAQFLRFFIDSRAQLEGFMPQFQTLNGAAGAFHSELIKLIAPYFGDRAPGLVNAMLAGSQGITSAEQGQRLVELGNLALREEPARAWFGAAIWRPGDWAAALEGTRFKTEFQGYLHEYGHRGVYELEIMNPRWIEDPAYLLETVRSQVLSGKELRLEDQSGKREAAMREVYGRLGLTPRGLQARFFRRQAGLGAAYREMGKSMIVKLMGVFRYACLTLGRRMAAEGLIETRDDIFHLSWFDVEAYIGGLRDPRGIRHLVEDRKARRREFLAQEPPDLIIGETPVKKAPALAAEGPVLFGTGVAAGQATGLARVIRHPDEGVRLQPGEILVAPSTDPAWTPLFLRAAGVVMEIGGYLSHGAIVAREYGLPAVANVPGLLQAVQDGELLTVDGDGGKVLRKG